MSDTTVVTSQTVEELMREQRLDEAIVASKAYLRAHPEDLEAWLRLGICCLLSRAEGDFLGIHEKAAGLVERRPELPTRTAELWRLYQRLFAKATAPFILVGASSLAACDRSPEASTAPEPLPAASVREEPEAPATSPAQPDPSAAGADDGLARDDPAASPAVPGAASDSPSAKSLASSAAPKPGSTEGSATAASKPTKPPKVSTHRYSGGVYHPPSPATHHKYSGGVYRGQRY